MKTKIKNIFLIILSLMSVFPLVACNGNTLSYEAFITDASLSGSGVDYQIEKNIYKTEEKNDPSVPKTVTLNINGYTLEGAYSHSEKIFPNIFYKHFYYSADRSYDFSLDDSGQLLTLFISEGSGKLDTETKKELSEEECLAIAKDFILKTVSAKVDLEEYTVNEVKELEDRYKFEFKKYINGFATMDGAHVGVLKSGHVYSYTSTMFGKISANDMPKLDHEKIIQTIETKLDTLYRDVKGNYASIDYEEIEYYFTPLEDGKPAVYCIVSIRFDHGNGGSHGEMVSMLIT